MITTPSAIDGDTNMRVLNLNFNSLDFIGNFVLKKKNNSQRDLFLQFVLNGKFKKSEAY